MKTIRVYDLPTRLFHWLFAGLFVGAFSIAKIFDDDSTLYPFHMMLGLTLALTVLLRILWGFLGSRYARFSSFPLRPTELLTYFKDLLASNTQRRLAHNPAASWAALLMMGLALGLALTGYMMTQGFNKEFFEEVHELFANALIVIVIVHIAGIIFHTLKHRDGIAMSIIHGKKEAVEESSGIAKSHTAVGFLFLALTGLFVFHLNKNYDPNTQNLNLWGVTLALGERSDEAHENHGHEKTHHDDEDENSADD